MPPQIASLQQQLAAAKAASAADAQSLASLRSQLATQQAKLDEQRKAAAAAGRESTAAVEAAKVRGGRQRHGWKTETSDVRSVQ